MLKRAKCRLSVNHLDVHARIHQQPLDSNTLEEVPVEILGRDLSTKGLSHMEEGAGELVRRLVAALLEAS